MEFFRPERFEELMGLLGKFLSTATLDIHVEPEFAAKSPGITDGENELARRTALRAIPFGHPALTVITFARTGLTFRIGPDS